MKKHVAGILITAAFIIGMSAIGKAQIVGSSPTPGIGPVTSINNTTTNDIHAGSFYGDGSHLTGISGGTPTLAENGYFYLNASTNTAYIRYTKTSSGGVPYINFFGGTLFSQAPTNQTGMQIISYNKDVLPDPCSGDGGADFKVCNGDYATGTYSDFTHVGMFSECGGYKWCMWGQNVGANGTGVLGTTTGTNMASGVSGEVLGTSGNAYAVEADIDFSTATTPQQGYFKCANLHIDRTHPYYDCTIKNGGIANFAGSVTAASFHGDGSGLTGIPPSSVPANTLFPLNSPTNTKGLRYNSATDTVVINSGLYASGTIQAWSNFYAQCGHPGYNACAATPLLKLSSNYVGFASLVLENTEPNSYSSGGGLKFVSNRAADNAINGMMQLSFYGQANANATIQGYGYILGNSYGANLGSQNGQFVFGVYDAGTPTTYLTIDGHGKRIVAAKNIDAPSYSVAANPGITQCVIAGANSICIDNGIVIRYTSGGTTCGGTCP